jgi:hypothetical protein
VKSLLDKAREAALLAVETYNRPGTVFRSRAYIVLMQIAWTSLFLAIFHRQGIKPYYRKKNSRRFVRIDGEPKPWDLSDCIGEYWEGADNAVAQNLRFFIELRNKIEHRLLPELDIEIFGECQALLFNFEEMIEKEFGIKYALNESLAISLQFSRMRHAEKNKSIRQLMRPLADNVTNFIQKFRSTLSDDIFGDMAYSYRIFLIPNTGSHRSRDSIAVEFIPYEPDNPEQMTKYEKMIALVKERHVPVANLDRIKPSDVAKQVERALGPQKKFSASHHHVKCWRYYEVRPTKGSTNPAQCKIEFCQYDDLHKDYAYTKKWVEFLIAELQDDEKYRTVLGK